MGILTDTGRFTDKVDLSLAASIASAASIDINNATGNSIYITGTTTITSLGTATQPGLTRRLIFNDALLLTNGASLELFGGANITTVAGDIAVFMAKTTSVWTMVSWHRPSAYTGGQFDGDAIMNSSITSVKLGDACVINSKLQTREVVTLPDSNSTLSASDMINKGLFLSANTANRTRTTDTAVNIIAQLPGYQTGTSFEFTILPDGTSNTNDLTAGVGVTLSGSPVSLVANMPHTVIGLVTSPTTVTLYYKSHG